MCVSLEGSTDVSVDVTLLLQQASDMSATSKSLIFSTELVYIFNHPSTDAVGSDISSLVDPQVIITPNTQEPICRTIEVFNDTIYEAMEIFFVSMSTSNERVNVSSPVQVTIIDDDG